MGELYEVRSAAEHLHENRYLEYFDRAKEAVMTKITENEAAAAALAVTKSSMLSASASNVPDLDAARARARAAAQ